MVEKRCCKSKIIIFGKVDLGFKFPVANFTGKR